jgi:2-iminobutanoate/2-iminopropanoate deaminase
MMREIFVAGDPIPIGTRVGDLVHVTRLTGGTTGKLEEQGRRVLNLMHESVEAAGGALDNIAHVSFFFAELRSDVSFFSSAPRPGIAALNPLWIDAFPNADDRPTYKFMTAPLPTGCLVHLGYFAVIGARRKLLSVPGVVHTNPIPLGVAIGDYLFSSRVLPHDPATEKPAPDAENQTAQVFSNTTELLKAGGFSWRDVTQGRAFVAETAFGPMVDGAWRKTGTSGQLNLRHYAVAPALKVMLEVFCKREGQ